MIGEVIGSYRVVAELGQGGMGVVYRAHHVQLERPAALKMLLPRMSHDPAIVQRFFTEARAASAIDHPGIVEIYDFGTHTDGRAYLVMELLAGESLEQRLRRASMPPLEAAGILAQAASALAAAHARGIVHRDLKPDNLFLCPNELLPSGIQVKLLDFGIAKLLGDRAEDAHRAPRTETGVVMGTPLYMSPEQCMGRADVDQRTDLYALGCILFHMLTGRPPFVSRHGAGMIIAAHLRDEAPDVRALAPHVPGALAAITARLLAKAPAARYPSAHALRAALVATGAVAPSTAPADGDAALELASAPRALDRGATLASAPTAADGARPGPWTAGLEDALTTHGSAVGELGPGDAAAEPAAAADAIATRQQRPAAGGAIAIGQHPTARSGAIPPARRRGPAGDAIAAARPRRARGAWLAAGLVAAVAAAGAAAARCAAPTSDEPAAVAAPAAAIASETPAPRPPPPATTAAPRPAPATAAPECPTGQVRAPATGDRCCWPGQRWSAAAARCSGAPRCPPGTDARGETCAAIAARPAPGPAALPGAEAPQLELDSGVFAPRARIVVELSEPIRARPGHRAWLAVARAGSPPTDYSTWEYLEDGARSATLRAPTAPGDYEVRLHTDYPARLYHVARRVAFTVAPVAVAEVDPTPRAEQRFQLRSDRVIAGGMIELGFPAPLRPLSGEQFWVTVVLPQVADARWGAYAYVPPAARRMTIEAPTTPGDYEVRLHGNYPTLTTNVVHRARIRVEPEATALPRE